MTRLFLLSVVVVLVTKVYAHPSGGFSTQNVWGTPPNIHNFNLNQPGMTYGTPIIHFSSSYSSSDPSGRKVWTMNSHSPSSSNINGWSPLNMDSGHINDLFSAHFPHLTASRPSGFGNNLPSAQSQGPHGIVFGAPSGRSSTSSFDSSQGSSPPNGNSASFPEGKQSDQNTQEGSQTIPGVVIYDENNINTGGTKSDDSAKPIPSEASGNDIGIRGQNDAHSSGTNSAYTGFVAPSSFCFNRLVCSKERTTNTADLEAGNAQCTVYCKRLSQYSSGKCDNFKCCCSK